MKTKFFRGVVAVSVVLAALLAVFFVFPMIGVAIPMQSWNTVKQGMAKTEVIKALIASQVDTVEPSTAEHIAVSKENLKDIQKLMANDGICLTDNYRIGVNLLVQSDGSIAKTYESIEKIPELIDIRQVSDLPSKLSAALAHHPGLVAETCIPNSRLVALGHLGDVDIAYLKRYSMWRFHVPNSYSMVELRFNDDFLVRVDYYWRPFETP